MIRRVVWTDERLQHQFDSIDKRFEQVDKRFDRVDAELARVNDRLDGLHRLMVQSNVVIVAALIGLIATQL